MDLDVLTSVTELLIAVTVLVTSVYAFKTSKRVKSIDRAVNSQPSNTETMVSRVHGIANEQTRVAEELKDKEDGSTSPN